MKPCPNPPKGEKCSLCGGTFVCLDWNRPKAKLSTLAQQVADAQAEIAAWPDGKLARVKLAGGDQP